MLQLSEKFWISAGFRYEFIDTKAEGTYREMVYHPLTNELILTQPIPKANPINDPFI
ncbi:MAG: hypothetical protein IPG07_00815 [Crocinitomicaceae bacterium]|nr:hypothetical protein [Crocinitomicaceae bacterium]